MEDKNRSGFDRRTGEDRRSAYDLDHFLKGGKERRHYVERRWRKEMRKGWIRISKWSSVDPRTCNPKP
jgi:hypothetical protein